MTIKESFEGIFDDVENSLTWKNIKNIVIVSFLFIAPYIVANESFITQYLSSYVNPTIASTIITILILVYKEYKSGTNISGLIGSIATLIVEETLKNAKESQKNKENITSESDITK